MAGPSPNIDIGRVLTRFTKDDLAIPEQCENFVGLVDDTLGQAATDTDGWDTIISNVVDALPGDTEITSTTDDQIAEMLGSADRIAAIDDGYIDALISGYSTLSAAAWNELPTAAAQQPDPTQQIPGAGDGSLISELPPAAAITDDALINPLLTQFLSKVPTLPGGGGGAGGGGGPTPTPTGINPRPPQRGRAGLISVLSDASVNWVVSPSAIGPINVYVTDASGKNLFGSDYNGSQVASWLWNNTALNVTFTVEDGNGLVLDHVDTSTMPVGIEAG